MSWEVKIYAVQRPQAQTRASGQTCQSRGLELLIILTKAQRVQPNFHKSRVWKKTSYLIFQMIILFLSHPFHCRDMRADSFRIPYLIIALWSSESGIVYQDHFTNLMFSFILTTILLNMVLNMYGEIVYQSLLVVLKELCYCLGFDFRWRKNVIKLGKNKTCGTRDCKELTLKLPWSDF